MPRFLAVLLFLAALAGTEAQGQWVFNSSAYQGVGRGVRQARQKVRSSATRWQAEADAAYRMPRASFEWDSSGTLGRRDRDAQWRHDEAMTGWQKYLEGLQDGINASRPWYGPIPGPLPPIVGPPPAKPRGTK